MKSLRRLLVLLPAALSLSAQFPPPSSAIFDKDAVHEIRLTFKDPNWYQTLTNNYDQFPDDTPYTEASIVWGEYKFDSIGVRFKGNSSYRGATTRKKPFRIKLNQFVKGQKLEGMASFGLSNGWSDPSFVREKAYYELAAKAGLAANRSNFAALYVNDEYMGLYILGEIVNGDFLQGHFAKGDDKGNLYKASDPGATLAYLGESPAPYKAFFSKESNEDADDWTDLIELARIFDQTPADQLPARIEKLIDVDSFLTALALDNITVNLDSYVGMAQNYFLYRRPSDQKWVWIPWDPSLAFGALGQNQTGQSLRDLPLEYTQTGNTFGGAPGGQVPGGGGLGGGAATNTRPLATKLWAVPAYKARYRQIYQALADQVMIPNEVILRMNQLRDLIRPYVERDTQKLVTQAQFDNAMTADATTGIGAAPGGGQQGGGAPGGGAPALIPFIEARSVSVKAQLAGKTPPLFSAVPLSLVFAQVASSTTAATQTLALTLPEGTGTYSAKSSAPWLTLSGAQGALPANVRLTASAAGMSAGTYVGTVTVTVAGTTNSPLAIPVTLVVTASPAIIATPNSLTFTSGNFLLPGPGGPQGPGQPQGNATQTQTLTVASTAGASPFTATLTDSTCAASAITLSASSGTTPGTLTVTANTAGLTANCNARIAVASAGLAGATVPVNLTVANPNGPGGPGGFPGGFPGAPTITSIANGASYAAGPLAPGTVATLFGTNLATAGVLFDGVPAPVISARANQLSVVVPFDVAGKTQSTVQLTVNNLPIAAPVQQPIGPTSPGIFTVAATGVGQATLINATGTQNGPNALAAKGSTVSIYLTGAGVLRADQTIAVPVSVSIGGQPATVSAATIAPGSAQGVYRITAVVPQTTPGGSVPVSVTVGGATSQPGVTMYVQ